MAGKRSKSINVVELFGCTAPLKFYERCAACVRFHDNCSDLALGIDILRRSKKIEYSIDGKSDASSIHISDFKCSAPIYYYERTRKKCPHTGRCREEGLLLALLTRKKTLDYSHKEVIEFPAVRRRRVVRPAHLKPLQTKAAEAT